MTRKIQLDSLTQQEVLTAAETLNIETGNTKRRIIVTPDEFSSIEEKLRHLPNTPGFSKGEITPGAGGYLYNIPVFIEKDSDRSYML
jgi:hypothetical protein